MSQSGFERTSDAERQSMPPERKPVPLWPWALLVIALAAVFALRALRATPEAEQRGEHDPAVGAQLTDFRLEPLTGDARSIAQADLEGKVTLVNFWGPWCPACAIEFPHLVELEEHFRQQPNFQFFSVSTNADPTDDRGLREGTEAFLKQRQASFPTYHDPQAQTMRRIVQDAKLADFAFPATFVLGPGGVIRGLWIGYIPGDEKAVRQAIESSLAKIRAES